MADIETPVTPAPVVKKCWIKILCKWICDRIACAWHYIWAFLSNDPKNDITFCIFAAASITSIVLCVRYMNHFNDNDIKAIGILQGGGTLPQTVKTAGTVIDAIKSKVV